MRSTSPAIPATRPWCVYCQRAHSHPGGQAGAGLLHYAALRIDDQLTHGRYVNGVIEARRALGEQARLGIGEMYGRNAWLHDSEDYSGTTTPELDTLRRKLIAYAVLANDVCGYNNAAQVYGHFVDVRETAQRIAT